MKTISLVAMISFLFISMPLKSQVMLPEEQEERVPSETFDYENSYHGDEASEVLREEQQDVPAESQDSAWTSEEEEYQEDAYLE